MSHTLGQYVHRVIDLDIHVVTNSGQLILLCADNLPIDALDFPGGIALLGELSRDDDSSAILLGLESFLSLVFYVNCDFRSAVKGMYVGTSKGKW